MAEKLLFVLNDAGYFLSHRLPIALAAKKSGFEVHVATPDSDKTTLIRAHGLIFHPWSLTRSGINPFTEISAFFALARLFRRIKPDVLHLVTIKPVIYGGMAARLLRVPAVVVAVPGLGFVFSGRGFKAGILRSLVSRLYRAALKHPCLCAIFQNSENAELVSRLAGLQSAQICLIRGAGVDLTTYAFTPLPSEHDAPLVMLPARLLRAKGVMEFVEAARQLRKNGVPARFALVGATDAGNPDTVSEQDIAHWAAEGAVEYWGYRADMPTVLALSSLVVLPSYYPEGLPRVLIEAQACGRAVITTDHPGCRAAITPDVSGLLVPVRDAVALAKAMARLLNDWERLQAMGKAGRALAEEAFDVRQVVARHLEIYRSLLQAVQENP
ncbi:MAG: glycosyltransferase family 4 protein [Zoogloeaceae bacterium]|jgi:glycosyltransferase involved in cell wall biosynthesis|nr:glycosyltransferase family 4 protein [Zoogloeaceae bacterium]